MLRSRLGAAVVVAALVAGCSMSSGEPDPVGETGKITVRILSGTDTSINAGDQPLGGATGIYAQLANWWNRNMLASTKIEIRLDTVRGGATTGHSQMVSEAQDGSGDVDLYNLDGPWLEQFVRGGYVRPLDDLVEQKKIRQGDFLPRPWASALDSEGRLYAVPFTTDAGLLYYRQSLVTPAQVAGVRDFAGLAALADGVMRGPHSSTVSEGYVGQFANYEGLTVNALEAIWSHAPGAFTGGSQDLAGIARGLTELVRVRRTLPATDEVYDEAKAAADFADGHAAMMRNWPIYYARILAGGPGTITAGQFKVVPLPYPSVLGGQNLAISRDTKHFDAAVRVLQFLTDRNTQRCLFAVGGFPPTRQDAFDEAWTGSSPLPGLAPGTRDLLCGTAKGKWTALGPTIRQAVAAARPRPALRDYTRFSDLLSAGTSALFTDQDPAGATGELISDLAEAAKVRR
jgi:multiple sugar transport system substrate-binding protein